ncbi:MAG: 5-methylcytosine-specific restriction endonuclease McrA [Candidatus Aldehydirespiratoraceae bacterium]|jgi:5-methylcytosine-specific restriction endonuclease McrA
MGVRTPTVLAAPLTEEFRSLADVWRRSLVRIVRLASAFADSPEWVVGGWPTAANALSAIADVEASTAREWIRIGRQLLALPASADAFDRGDLSYSKLRTLSRVATSANEAELLEIALRTPAGELGRALAAWMNRNSEPEELDSHHQRQRSITERVEPDGMTSVTMRLPPLVAAAWSAALTVEVMRTTRRPAHASADPWPTLAQQKVDALRTLLGRDGGGLVIEVVLHIRADGCTLDDGTPIPDSVVERVAPTSFLRALIHDAEGRPINASGRQRHPSTRQKRVVKEREPACRDCGRTDLLQFDHVPPFEQTLHTVVEELEVRCSPCHRKRHGH